MKVLRIITMAVLFMGVFQSVDALAYDVYGSSAVIYDFANNRTRGYSRTQLDYDTAEYYTAYVCGELYKDGVWQTRACQSGLITATIYTQYTGTSSTGYVLSDHYVDMKYFDDEQQSYVDYAGYQFLPGYSYPLDWLFYLSEIFGYFNPVSIRLGSTHMARPRIRIVNNDFNPTPVSLSGDPITTASASISASSGCTNDPNCLRAGDSVVVEIIKDTGGGTFTYDPPSQNKEIALALGGEIIANFTVTVVTASPLPKDFQFTVRVLDVRRPSNSTSILGNVQLDPTLGGTFKMLKVIP